MKAVDLLRCNEEQAGNYINTNNMVFSIAGNTNCLKVIYNTSIRDLQKHNTTNGYKAILNILLSNCKCNCLLSSYELGAF